MYMQAKQIQTLLREKYAPPTYAYFPEVKASVGFSNRTADGVAIAMWRSHGLAVHGFEIKTYRGDWLRELKQPEKADEVSGYCDYWWIVASEPSIVKDGELPEGWGLMVPNSGGKLTASVKAPRLNPRPLDREFVCEIMRNFYGRKVSSMTSEDYERGIQEGIKREQQRHAKREENVAAFEIHSGIDLDGQWPERSARVGSIVKAVIDGDGERAKRDMEYMLRTGREVVSLLELALADRK